jgi:peptidoglycan/xylan/chitin deacetylase (PgdA/CDA1 family)
VNARVAGAAGAAGYPKTIMWSVDTIDWRPQTDGGPTASAISTKIRSAPGGSIVLMHLGGYNTLEALPWAFAGLRTRGLQPVSISGLIR